MEPENITPEARVAAMRAGADAVAVSISDLAVAMEPVAELRAVAPVVRRASDIIRTLAEISGKLSLAILARDAEIARLTAERDALRALVKSAYEEGWEDRRCDPDSREGGWHHSLSRTALETT